MSAEKSSLQTHYLFAAWRAVHTTCLSLEAESEAVCPAVERTTIE